MAYALFGSDGKLNRAAMRRQLSAMLAHGVHGVAVLGMATEVNKLSTAERRMLMEWAAEDVDGKVPLSVTVAESSLEGQVEFVRAAKEIGASWVILQPPRVLNVPEAELIRLFGAVADRAEIPVGIQNAPEYIGIGLSNAGLRALNRAHPNVTIAKMETSPIQIRSLLDETERAMDVFDGRGGVAILEALRAGAVGFIPGGECYDVLVRVYNQMTGSDPEAISEAERLHAEVLPLQVFIMQSLDSLIVYGKAGALPAARRQRERAAPSLYSADRIRAGDGAPLRQCPRAPLMSQDRRRPERLEVARLVRRRRQGHG
jgi:2-keto-3-deoxy-L-arabinonate dehydratase